MPRVKRGVTARRRRKRILKQAKGYQGARGRLHRVAREAVERAWKYAYRDRKQRKREFRALWIARINAAARQHDLSYSRLIAGLTLSRQRQQPASADRVGSSATDACPRRPP